MHPSNHRFCTISAVLALGGAVVAQAAPRFDTLEALIEAVEAKERAVKTVQVEMKSSGQFPGGPRFETRGTLRVLGRTHFYSSMTMSVGDEGRPQMQSETETCSTPDGVMMRNSDPMEGQVFVRMSRELLDDLESASRALGETETGVPGDDMMANGPLGSVMLRDLSEVFALELGGRAVVGKHDCYTVRGPRRTDVELDDEVLGGADRVELLVRSADLAVVRMTQFEAGRPITEIEIERIVLDEPLEEDSFRVEVPDGVKVLDAMEHPPHRAQIERLFEEAEAAGWKRGEGVSGGSESEKGGAGEKTGADGR